MGQLVRDKKENSENRMFSGRGNLPNAERRTPNAERRTQNAEHSTQNAEFRSAVKKALDSGKLDLGLVSAGSKGVEPYASLSADNETICAPCFIQFVVYPIRNPVVYRIGPRKKKCFADYLIAM